METFEHRLGCIQTLLLRNMLHWLRVADKSGGSVWYVNMTGSLVRYSQLLLQDLSKDLMLISKKTESCRLSMVVLKTWASPQGKNLQTAPLQSFQIPVYFTLKRSTDFLQYDTEANITLCRPIKTSSSTTVQAAAGKSSRKSFQPVSSAALNTEESNCLKRIRALDQLVSEAFNPSGYFPLAIPPSPSSPFSLEDSRKG